MIQISINLIYLPIILTGRTHWAWGLVGLWSCELFTNYCFIDKKYTVLLPPLTQRGSTNSAIQNTVVCLKPSTCNKTQCTVIDSIQWLQYWDWHMRINSVSVVQYWKYWGGYGSGVQSASCDQSLVRFPCSACRSVLGQDTEPQAAPHVLVGTLHCSHHHQCINLCMNYFKSRWTKVSAKCHKCKNLNLLMPAQCSSIKHCKAGFVPIKKTNLSFKLALRGIFMCCVKLLKPDVTGLFKHVIVTPSHCL